MSDISYLHNHCAHGKTLDEPCAACEKLEAADEATQAELARRAAQIDELKYALIGCMNSMMAWGELEDGMPNMKGVQAWDAWQIGKAALAKLEGGIPWEE